MTLGGLSLLSVHDTGHRGYHSLLCGTSTSVSMTLCRSRTPTEPPRESRSLPEAPTLCQTDSVNDTSVSDTISDSIWDLSEIDPCPWQPGTILKASKKRFQTSAFERQLIKDLKTSSGALHIVERYICTPALQVMTLTLTFPHTGAGRCMSTFRNAIVG